MSYQSKLDEARALLDQHNSNVPDAKGKIKVENFFNKLTAAGGTNDAGLSQCAWEDLQEFGLPKLLARQVATIFRAKENAKEEKPVLKKSKVEAMGVAELVQYYDPRDKGSAVTSRLQTLLGNKRFVVFNDDGTLNVEVSTKNARELMDDYPEREHVLVNDSPCKTYKLGERPDQSFDENPLYPGRILRPDGDCDQTNRSWAGVPLDVKQVIYLAVKNGEIKINSINDAHNILDLVLKHVNDARNITSPPGGALAKRFVKAASELCHLIAQGNAPRLKIFKKTEDKPNNPFGSHKTY